MHDALARQLTDFQDTARSSSGLLKARGQNNPKKVYIHIGGIHASKVPVVIETVLGSCVAVCLYDPITRIGGMNHILMPGKPDWKNFDSVTRYGINAMELLINRILTLGGERRRLLAKAFGGGHVIPVISKENGVGTKNIEFVLEFLHMESIKLVSHDLGGHDTRKIRFQTDTGEVLLKRIPPSFYPTITQEETKVYNRVKKEADRVGSVTLFD
ncbi:MAG: chemotaxis protein CheD [Desulfobacteraceae bacterium]|nr:chemotaxis protein CheD [Desulfobacteraceae bacterium]